MAFNPFNAFRKHQKVLFAGLTIVCMFTFVLTSGVAGFGRDFFSELPRWLGVGRGKNPPVATIFGQKYGEMDLRLLRERRFQALRTLSGAVDVAWRTVQQPPTDQNNFSEWLKQRTKVQKLGMQYLFAQMELSKPEDLLDFVMWRSIADQMGISFTDDDIDRLFDAVSLDKVSLRQMLPERSPSSRTTAEELRSAIGDEFRVQLARQAVLGRDEPELGLRMGLNEPSLFTTPADITPNEFWDYYKKNLTTVNVALLAIPVTDKTFQTDKEPTEREIKSLYNQYKDDEWSPEKATPGFKVPRQVKLTWIKAWPEATYYRNLGAQVTALLDDVTTATSPLVNLMGGGGPVTSLAQAAEPWIPDWRLVGLYENYRQKQQERVRTAESLFRYVPAEQPEILATAVGHLLASDGVPFAAASGSMAMASTLEARLTHPSLVAAAVGQLLGSTGTLASPFTTPAVVEGMVTEHLEKRNRFCTAAALIGGPVQSPLFAVQLAPTLATAPLPLALVRSYLVNQLTDQMAREVAVSELESVKTQLSSFSKNVKARQAWVDKELPAKGPLPTYHFNVYRTEQLHTQYNLEQDPSFKQLEETFDKDQPATAREPGAFAKQVIGMQMAQPQDLPSSPAMWKDAEEPVVYWVSEEKAPYVPPLDDKVRKKVVEAWKLQQEREKAKQEATRVVDELKKRPRTQGEAVVMPLRDEASKHNWQVFDLNRVSRLVAPGRDQMVLSPQAEYPPYTVPKADKDKLRYPPANIADQLVDNLKQPGDVTLVADGPEKTFYVAVLRERLEPSLDQFYEQTYKKFPGRDTLWNKVEADRQKDYRDAVVKELRKEAGLTDADGNPKYQLDPEFRKQLEGRMRDEE